MKRASIKQMNEQTTDQVNWTFRQQNPSSAAELLVKKDFTACTDLLSAVFYIKGSIEACVVMNKCSVE